MVVRLVVGRPRISSVFDTFAFVQHASSAVLVALFRSALLGNLLSMALDNVANHPLQVRVELVVFWVVSQP